MTRYRFYVGTTDQDDMAVCHRYVEIHLTDTFEGFTAYPAKGAWYDTHMKMFREDTIVYEVLASGMVYDPKDSAHEAERHAKKLAKLAHQTCVLWTVEEVVGGFAYAK